VKTILKNSDDGNSGSRKCKRAYNAYGIFWHSMHLTQVCGLELGGQFYAGAFGRNLTSVIVKIFFHV
jgi:hypothetical protein